MLAPEAMYRPVLHGPDTGSDTTTPGPHVPAPHAGLFRGRFASSVLSTTRLLATSLDGTLTVHFCPPSFARLWKKVCRAMAAML